MKLSIVGGTYVERCLFPEWNGLFGSGLRAALCASSLGAKVSFHTLISDDYEPVLQGRAANKFTVHAEATSPTLCFDYVHGFSRPHITPPMCQPPPTSKPNLHVKADCILRYGLLEGQARVKGDRVIYDPQNPWKPEPFSANESTANHLALVLNIHEARLLSRECDLKAMAHVLGMNQQAEAVIIKCGSRGCYISEHGEDAFTPAYRTPFVWPIGSGDIFSSTFATFWGCQERSAAEAAELASKATAIYCSTMNAEIPPDFTKDFAYPPSTVRDTPRKRVYLAGPFFNMPQRWLIEEAKVALESQGFDVFSPFHEVGPGDADAVYGPDMKGVDACDIMFACVDGLDTGTIYEIGYAHSRNKPVVVLVQNEREEDLKMLVGGGCIIEKDFVTAIYRTRWHLET